MKGIFQTIACSLFTLVVHAQTPKPLVRFTFDQGTIATQCEPNTGTLGRDCDLTISGSIKYTDGAAGVSNMGKSLDLSASEMAGTPKAFASSEKQSKLTGLSELTVTGWYKIAEQFPHKVFIITCGAGTNSSVNGWQIKTTTNNRLTLSVGREDAKTDYLSYSQAFSRTETWQFFAVIWQENLGATWYAGTETITPKPVGSKKASQKMGGIEQAIIVGRLDEKTGAFKGLLDDIAIFDTMLSPEQIKTIYLEARKER